MTVGDYAFANTGIVEIRLPVSVVTVGSGALIKLALSITDNR